MKRLFIHLGTGKTGSTAIQHFMADNTTIIAKNHGIKYADSGQNNSHHHLLCANFAHNAKESRRENLKNRIDTLRQEIENSPEHTFVISSENFPGVLDEDITRYYIEPLKKLVEIHCVVYFRRQDEYLESWYAQTLKAGTPGSGAGIERLYNRLSARGTMDFHSKAESWGQHIGRENVHVRPYERSQFHGGNVIHDFASVLGIGSLDNYTFRRRESNPSLSRDQVLAIEAMHQAGLGDYIKPSLRKPMSGGSNESRFRLSPTRRQEIIDDWAEVNAAVARDYLNRTNGILFTNPSPIETDASWTPKESPAPEYLLRFVKSMIDDEHDQLASRIAALEKRLAETP